MGAVKKFQCGRSEGLVPGEVSGPRDLTWRFLLEVRETQGNPAAGGDRDSFSREKGFVAYVTRWVWGALRDGEGTCGHLNVPKSVDAMAVPETTLHARRWPWREVVMVGGSGVG